MNNSKLIFFVDKHIFSGKYNKYFLILLPIMLLLVFIQNSVTIFLLNILAVFFGAIFIIIATIIPIDFYYRYQHSISYKELKHFTWSLFIIFIDALVILSLLISGITNSLVTIKFIEIEYLLFWFLLLGHTFLLLFLVALFNGLILFLWSALRIIPNYIKKLFVSFKSIFYLSENLINQPLLSNERVEKFDDIILKTYKRIANSTLFLHFIISIFFSLHLKHFFIGFYINHPTFSGSLMEMIIKDSFALYEKIFLLTLVKPFFNLFQNFFSKKEVSSHS